MREITAAKLKQLFLDAFEHSLRSGSVDYIAATEEAFRDVRRMEQDYNALVAAGPLVEALVPVHQRAGDSKTLESAYDFTDSKVRPSTATHPGSGTPG